MVLIKPSALSLVAFLASSVVGQCLVSATRSIEHRAVVIGRQFDDSIEHQAACFNRLDSLLRRQPQLKLRPARFAEDDCIFARTLMPVNNCKMTVSLQHLSHGTGQTGSVRDAMKGICHEYEINSTMGKIAEVISVAGYEITIADSILPESTVRRFQHIAVDVYRDDMAGYLGHRQGEPSIARAEIDRVGARDKSDRIQNGARIGP
jgi:hypothetical protein